MLATRSDARLAKAGKVRLIISKQGIIDISYNPIKPFFEDGGRPDVLARKALLEETRKGSSWWSCDRCDRLNKPRNQRCGGCQRWRGGSRPQMRKKQHVQSILPPIV